MRLTGVNGRNYSMADITCGLPLPLPPASAFNQLITNDIARIRKCEQGLCAPADQRYCYHRPQPGAKPILSPRKQPAMKIGSKGRILHKKLNYELAIYTMDVKEQICGAQLLCAGSTTTTYTKTMNAGKGRHQGVELSLNYNYDLPAGAFISLVRPFVFVYLYRRPLY